MGTVALPKILPCCTMCCSELDVLSVNSSMLFQKKRNYHSCLWNFSQKIWNLVDLKVRQYKRKYEKGLGFGFKWVHSWFLSCHHWENALLVYNSIFLSKKTQTSGTMMYCLVSPCSTQNYCKTKAQSETVTMGHTKRLHILQPQALERCNDYFVRILLLFSNT